MSFLPLTTKNWKIPVRRACFPSTLSSVLYIHSPMTKLQYIHAGPGPMKSGTSTWMVTIFMRIQMRPSNVIRFGASHIGSRVVM
jgi:hypothetical protein